MDNSSKPITIVSLASVRSLTGTADETLLNSYHSTTNLRPPYNCRSNRGSGFSPVISAAVADPALGASSIDLCQSAVEQPTDEFPNSTKQWRCIWKAVSRSVTKCNAKEKKHTHKIST